MGKITNVIYTKREGGRERERERGERERERKREREREPLN